MQALNNLSRLALAASLAALAVSVVFAVIGQNANSLWTDELFSHYFSDPTTPTLGAAANRAAESVNPPLFYLLLRAARIWVDGDFATIGRSLAALWGCLALVALYFAIPKDRPIFIKVFAPAFAATSMPWYFYVQEIRSYTAVFLLLTISCAIFLRLLQQLHRRDDIAAAAIGLAALTSVSCGVHYITVPINGGLFAVALLFCRDRRSFLYLIGGGALSLVPVGLLAAWQIDRIAVDTGTTWMQSVAISDQLWVGLKIVFGSTLHTVVAVGVLAMFAVEAMLRLRTDPSDRMSLVIAVSPALALLVGWSLTLLLSHFAIPIYSFRFHIASAPLLWLTVALMLDVVIRGSFSRNAGIVTICVAALLLADASKVIYRQVPIKQPWRELVQMVGETGACRSAAIPVDWFEQAMISNDDPAEFYDFYNQHPGSVTWLPVSREDHLTALTQGPIAEIVARRLSGRAACPFVMLWPHIPNPNNASELARQLNRAMPTEGRRVAAYILSGPKLGLWAQVTGANFNGQGKWSAHAAVLIAVDDDQPDR